MLSFKIVEPLWTEFVARTEEPENPKSRVRILDSKKTWLTLKAGDHVMTRWRDAKDWTRQTIEHVELFIAHPNVKSGIIVTCGQDWLDACPLRSKADPTSL